MIRKLALFLVLALIAAGTAVAFIYVRTQQPYQGYQNGEQFVDIPPGSSTVVIGDRLVSAGVVRDPLTYRAAVLLSRQGRSLKAGEYRFDRPMTPLEVVSKIGRGDVYVISLTFPEGLTMGEMGAIAESHGIASAAAFRAAAGDPALIKTIDPAARTLEGFLFPETYRVSRKTDAGQLVRLMVDRATRVLSPELRTAAERRGLSIHQVVTLASLVEKETARAD
jgi:UPF0755 protein